MCAFNIPRNEVIHMLTESCYTSAQHSKHDTHGNLRSNRVFQAYAIHAGSHSWSTEDSEDTAITAGARGPTAPAFQPAGRQRTPMLAHMQAETQTCFLKGSSQGREPAEQIGGRGQGSPLQPLCMGAAGPAQPHGCCHCSDQVCASGHSIRNCP